MYTKEARPEYIAKITDFGGAISMNSETDVNEVFGQIEFTEPHYMNNMKKYKKDLSSDIYSLGVVFWEISSGKFPFGDYKQNSPIVERKRSLSVAIIVLGKREKVVPQTPEKYSLLYQRCWEPIRTKRPTIKQIIKFLNNINDNYITINELKEILMPTCKLSVFFFFLILNIYYILNQKNFLLY